MTDCQLEELNQLQRLHDLDVSGCAVLGDRGLMHLAKLPSLQRLSVDRTSVTGSGLQGLTGLTSLMLGFCARLSHAGMEAIARRVSPARLAYFLPRAQLALTL